MEASDTDALLAGIERLCDQEGWDELAELRRLLAEAGTRGKQLWGVDEHIRYRMALQAPPEWAGPVLNEGPARHTLGPLPEVAASTHEWVQLEPHLAAGPLRAIVAHERVVRGEQLDGAEIDGHVLEVPLHLAAWEPSYQLATYHSDRVETPPPPLPPMEPIEPINAPEPPSQDPAVAAAINALTSTWVEESNGRSSVAASAGGMAGAIAAFGLRRASASRIPAGQGMAWMAWAAASGGAYGRRKGAAAGRFAAWWAAATLAGLDFPCPDDQLGAAVESFRWYAWSDLAGDSGWALKLAVEVPTGVTWAISAGDSA